MGNLYNSLEGEILRKVIDYLSVGGLTEISEIQTWRVEKLQQLHLFNKDVVQIVSQFTPYAEEEVKKMFEDAVGGVIEDVDKALPYDVPQVPPTHIDNIMRGYFNQSWSEIDNFVNQTLIATNYGYGTASQSYTETLNRTSALFNTGIYNFDEALEKSVQELAQKGIRSTFIDKGERAWSIESYVRTVLKSTLNNTYNEVKKERMGEFGVNHVVVTAHMGSRLACSFIQGQVIDLRPMNQIPNDSEYRSIYDPSWNADFGEAHGHRGVNCGHQHIPFIPGVNTNNQPEFDAEKNKEVADNRDKQRYMERNIVKYKKNLMVAEELGSPKQEHWRGMINKWDNKLEEHLNIKGDYLTRQPEREEVYMPLETLMGEVERYI